MHLFVAPPEPSQSKPDGFASSPDGGSFMSRDGKQRSFLMMNKLTRQLDKSSPFGRAGIAQAMTERVSPIGWRGFVLLKVIPSADAPKIQEAVCAESSDLSIAFLACSGYNQTIDSNGAVGHLLTRSAVFVRSFRTFGCGIAANQNVDERVRKIRSSKE